jgi:hypothetical protein
VIVTKLHGRIGPSVVTARCAVVITVLGGLLVVAIIRPILRVQCTWAQSRERERDDN